MLEKFLSLSVSKKIATLSASACLIASLILAIASYHSSRQIILSSTELIGESLAGQLANDASNALVQGNKLSLQVLLKNIVRNPLIIHGAIYDISHRPIAEAGTHNDDNTQSFSASISFQDSLAGYAVVTLKATHLEQEAQAQYVQLAILGILLSTLVFWFILKPATYLSDAIRDLTSLAKTPTHRRNQNTRIAYRGNDELLVLAQAIIDGPEGQVGKSNSHLSTAYAALTIRINNAAELTEQQTTHNFSEKLHAQLERICHLYEGQLFLTQNNHLNIIFAQTDDDNYPFRAVCSAYILKSISQQEQNACDISIGLTIEKGNVNTTKINNLLARQQACSALSQLLNEQELAQQTQQVLITNSLKKHPNLIDKISCTALGEHHLLKSLEEPYQSLLDGQLAALLEASPKQ